MSSEPLSEGQPFNDKALQHYGTDTAKENPSGSAGLLETRSAPARLLSGQGVGKPRPSREFGRVNQVP